jgi:hypothetical protein
MREEISLEVRVPLGDVIAIVQLPASSCQAFG